MKEEPNFNEKRYQWQMNHLANAILIEDYNPALKIKEYSRVGLTFSYKMPKGSLVSGSYLMNEFLPQGSKIDVGDIDLYFSSKDEAYKFLMMNVGPRYHDFDFSNPMCSYGTINGMKFNLIYGVEFDSPGHLISRFDIRACSVAWDVNENKVYEVLYAMDDIQGKNIVFNPVPRGVSVRRLVKYVNKGFSIDKYQNLFFAELIRSPIYNAELELSTKDY
jgi:hypothetical protein